LDANVVPQVLRALYCSRSGEIKEVTSRDFLRENWGDVTIQEIVDREKVEELVRGAGVFKKRMDRISQQHWHVIISTSKSFISSKKGIVVTDQVIKSTPEEDEEYEKALFDPMFA
jgi:hypothetical protein